MRYTRPESASRKIDATRPISNQPLFSKGGDVRSIAPIPTLLSAAGPFAVKWPILRVALRAFTAGVMSIIVDTVKRAVLRRSWSHILKEALGRLPSLADLNSSPSVSGIVGSIRVGCALLHGVPRVVVNGVVLSMRRSKTPTASSSIGTQAVATQDVRVPTIAQAFPVVVSTDTRDESNDRQLAVTISGQVNSRISGSLYFFGDMAKVVVGHLISPIQKLVSRGRRNAPSFRGLVSLKFNTI